MWTPVTKETIEKNISWCNDILFGKPDCLKFWEYIRVEPEKWFEETMGQEGGGFWVVAILGKNIIYYNDIEEGYNQSTFTSYGTINDYNCGQLELYELVESLYFEITSLKK
jgi:hypothetical protein